MGPDTGRSRPPSERDASSFVAGRRPVLELLRSGRPAERILISSDLAPSRSVGDIRRAAEAAAIPVRVVPRTEIDRAAPRVHHQGVVALTGRFRYAAFDDLLEAAAPTLLFVDGVMDPHNLGSLLRSADGAGFTGVIIPARRAAAVTPTVRRVSAGAAEVVPVARVSSLPAAIDRARAAGVWVVGLAQDAPRPIYESHLLEPPVALILGSEDRGMSRSTAGRCDEIVRIPSRGRLGSLNVAVAGAVAMFEVARRRAPSDRL